MNIVIDNGADTKNSDSTIWKKICNWICEEKWFLGYIFINVLLLFILIITNSMEYETMDDFYEYAYYSGLFGTYYPRITYCSVIYGAIMCFMFKMFPIVNWATLLDVLLALFSYIAIGYVFMHKSKRKLAGFLYAIIFLLVTHNYIYCYINFSKIALLSFAAGLMLIFYSFVSEKVLNRFLVCGMILCFFGCIMRDTVVMMSMAFGLVMLIYYIRNQALDKRKIVAAAGIICMLAVVLLVKKVAYASPEWQEALAVDKLTVGMRDYNTLPPEDYDKIDFKKVALSPEDLYMLDGLYFADRNVFSVENLTEISEYEQKPEFSLQYCHDVLLDAAWYCVEHSLFVIIFLIVLSPFLFTGSLWVETITTVAIMFGEILFLVYRGRYPERVGIIPWIMAYLIVVFLIQDLKEEEHAICSKGYYTYLTIVLAFSFLLSGVLRIRPQERIYENIDEYNAFISNINNKSKKKLLLVDYVSGPFASYTIWQCPQKDVWKDAICDAGCMSMYPDIIDKIEPFGSTKSPYEAMVKSDFVYMVGNRYLFERRNFIRQHYGDELDICRVCSGNDISAYSVSADQHAKKKDDIADWTIDFFEGETDCPLDSQRFYQVLGTIKNYEDADIYYMRIKNKENDVYYEMHIDGNNYSLAVPIDTWYGTGKARISIVRKQGNKVVEDDNIEKMKFEAKEAQ